MDEITGATELQVKLMNIRKWLLSAQPHDYEAVYEALIALVEALAVAEGPLEDEEKLSA